MTSISAVGGLSTALNSTTVNKQPGPPDHAKAWGWRAKQAAPAEETQAVAPTEPSVPAEITDAVQAVGVVDETSQDAATTLPPPSEADMESIILGLAASTADAADQVATAEYDVAALFM
ncbi:hypothetical protein [Parasedimentitalea psychrophila]|uniref:Uncharacterized protein n=1 Tax=Parasedimentitalea psychrophila TaxID=2997337 RepID=A0A9Y2KZG8_9RHOB|nr:hypothetical protein [Parasedimentitalea psychrophila]WIY25970.1 hypothetical protein QPJ95_03260 [Parasedimentitalea psychrophila]